MNSDNKFNKLKMLFVQPSHLKEDGTVWKSKLPWLPRLALPQLAAITPDDFETTIVDEYIEDIDFNADVDSVAITATTVQAPRAYQIAKEFIKRGKKTIMGGIHASLLPEESQKHVDSVVIGEAEGVWEEVLADLKHRNLKPVYLSRGHMDITHIPSPKLSKLPLHKYKVDFKLVQTTRGCPHNCGYCSVTKFFGSTYRHRSIEDVVRELEEIASEDIFFVDDNIAANPERAKALFKAITPLKKSWISQCCMHIAYNEELLELARESGCVNLMIGFESLSEGSLKSVNKSFNKVDDYFYVAEKLHSKGISVMGLMVFGFDYADETIFEKTVKFMDDAKIDFPCYWVLTPYPKTPLYQQLESEGRIFERDWSKYDCTHVVFKPKLMTSEVLENGYYYACKSSYSVNSIIKRLTPSSLRMAKSLIDGFPARAMVTYLFRQGALKGYHPMMG
ncbi:MAG: hypothetical protein A3C43_05420 [Candidatus Schekmanbacteria bacterium RIFCSPHIGHO2_02_FULL_38_11]|uniref:Uncharacterized protein n=1 Tax=Candidatus Schekmanbacteria bacterium RIFCSPLOWO2_12_FULL_38_15 TaxID=1817883 RepID=A0A1F7SM87_9BACT|nr:MAG: hypothetical protein A2043_01095 [Candidatus Schekmanbacteria bacterium GWA2_38_9]OGL50982.1 MAG: hypothetical protein A3H37_10925 [Candidatus Schekmanbacteria bacterium RIFCSPLOWO2_02_FULL_38_14]OGL53831.1 MAG: hypothetical protein A3C43_05420 [Candidatus Schekmanbacteria bacterium RIFCSPHIGHO2_02_FULL_38_11]OGL54889.1 MAG: hypothetical protein A3G31_02085 [Candidatus Schekmanbacteria bacterium RIFCSPLOWO2_12_FULL_38_15]